MQKNNNDNFLNEIDPNILTELSPEEQRIAEKREKLLEEAKVEKKAYLEEMNKPVDNSYTANNKYFSRVWQEEYKTPSLEMVDPKTNKITLNEYGYLSDRIVDNIEENTEKGIGASDKNRIQMKSQQYKTDLYAFAASMRNEVYLEKDGKFNERSFFQFCTRIYDGNNKAVNNLVKKGYFGKNIEHISDIKFDKFITGCANEVFKTNVLLPEDKDTPDLKYSEVYEQFGLDIMRANDVNIENANSKKYNIDYSIYASKEQSLQNHQFEAGSYKYLYRIPTMTPFQHVDRDIENVVLRELTPEEKLEADKRTKELQDYADKLVAKKEEPKKEEVIPSKTFEDKYLEEFEAPIIPTEKDKKNLKKQIGSYIKQIIKEQYDAQNNVPEELKNTTESYAKGIKAAFEDFPNWDRLPEDIRKDAAREFKFNLDKNIDGEKQAAQTLKDFYNNLHYDRNKINKNNPKHVEMLENMRKDGLHVDALSSYFRLTEIHEKRNGVFWLFHPFQNKAEKAAIDEMKNVLKEDFKLSDKDLEPYYIDKNGNKKLNSPKLGDEMIDAIMGTCDKKTAKILTDQKEMRKNQVDYYAKLAESPEEAKKLQGEQVKFKIEDIYPELYGINSLSKASVNKEKTVEKGMNK